MPFHPSAPEWRECSAWLYAYTYLMQHSFLSLSIFLSPRLFLFCDWRCLEICGKVDASQGCCQGRLYKGRQACHSTCLTLVLLFSKRKRKKHPLEEENKNTNQFLDVSHCSTCAPILSLRYFDFLGAVLMVCAYGMEWFGQPAYYKYRH